MSQKCDGIVLLARELVGKAKYKLCALASEAPEMVDCSSLTQYLYKQIGVYLPRLAYEQLAYCRTLGAIEVEISEVEAGDLIFTSGFSPTWDKKVGGVGHVSIAVDKYIVVTAMIVEGRNGVFEMAISELLRRRKLYSITRPYVCS